MKKLLAFIVSLLFISGVVTAQSSLNIPTWMGKSMILLSEFAYGEYKTINDLFTTPNEYTEVTTYATENELLISHEMVHEETVVLKANIYFKLQKAGDAGTCYISKVYYESPLQFKTQTYTCTSPYDISYGEILGFVTGLVQLFYQQ